mmetsp:Transcript_26103/g.49338  ORF Transcript_26103/g.49338 Transcript_26103/m.49338 type:complete len:261 (-) Transcript_26103:3512-4294(-)
MTSLLRRSISMPFFLPTKNRLIKASALVLAFPACIRNTSASSLACASTLAVSNALLATASFWRCTSSKLDRCFSSMVSMACFKLVSFNSRSLAMLSSAVRLASLTANSSSFLLFSVTLSFFSYSCSANRAVSSIFICSSLLALFSMARFMSILACFKALSLSFLSISIFILLATSLLADSTASSAANSFSFLTEVSSSSCKDIKFFIFSAPSVLKLSNSFCAASSASFLAALSLLSSSPASCLVLFTSFPSSSISSKARS